MKLMYRLVQAYKNRKFLQTPMSTPFLRVRSWFINKCVCMFFFSPDISVYAFFGGYLGLKGPHIFGEERKKQHS